MAMEGVSLAQCQCFAGQFGLWRNMNGKEVGFVGPRDDIPVPLFIRREVACL